MSLLISRTNLATNSSITLIGNTPVYVGDVPNYFIYENVLNDDYSKNIKILGHATIINELHFGAHNNIEYVAIIGHNIPNNTTIEILSNGTTIYTSFNRFKNEEIFFKFSNKFNTTDLTIKFTGVINTDISITQISFGELMTEKSFQGGIIIPTITTNFNENVTVDELTMPISKKQRRKPIDITISLPNETINNIKNEWSTFINNFNDKTFFISMNLNTGFGFDSVIPCFNLIVDIKNHNSTRNLGNVSLKFKTFYGN